MHNERKIQVHAPYRFLLEKMGEFLDLGINPEVYIDGENLDSALARDLEKIGSDFRARGLRVTMHGPYIDLNPGSADEQRRLFTVERYNKAFEAASYLKPVNIVLHAGYSEKRFKEGPETWLSQSLKTWPAFVKRAEGLGTRIAAEHIFEKGPETLKGLIEAIGSPHFGACIDSGHMNVFSQTPMEEWIRQLGPYIAEVHMHDNSGNSDDHLPIGDGSIDFGRLLGLLDEHAKDPVLTIEPHGEVMLHKAIKAAGRFFSGLKKA